MAPKAPDVAPSRAPLALGLLVLAGVVLLAARAREEARQSPRFRVDPTAVQVAGHPDWLPADLAAQLARHLGQEVLGAPATLVDPGALRAWEPALAEASWVREVLAVEPRFPGRARVRLRLRRPVVELPEGWLAAADGRLLGQGSVRLDPPPLRLTGSSRPDELAACAAAAAELLPFRGRLDDWGVRVVEVSAQPGGRVLFRDDRGVLLDWGRPRDARDPYAEVDLTPELKIRNLMEALQRKPGLVGVARVELWLAEPVLHPAGG